MPRVAASGKDGYATQVRAQLQRSYSARVDADARDVYRCASRCGEASPRAMPPPRFPFTLPPFYLYIRDDHHISTTAFVDATA